MIKVIDSIEQMSPEWFALRCGSLGASSVKNAIAGGQGKVRKTLAYQLAAEVVTGKKHSIPTTAAMSWGIETEPEARETFKFITGLEVTECAMIKNDMFLGCHASPDGLCSDGAGLEIKCPQPATHVKYLVENRLPPEYKAQVQFSMMIAEYEAWWFMSYYPGMRPLILKIDADPEYHENLQEKVDSFLKELAEISKAIV